MIQNVLQLESILENTLLQDTEKELIQFTDQGYESVIAIRLSAEIDALQAWQHLYDQIEITGRYPILVMDMFDDDTFSRYGFDDEDRGERVGDAPNQIIQASENINLAEEFKKISEDESISLDEIVEMACDETLAYYGQVPHIENIDHFLIQHQLNTLFEIEHWFLQWEIQHCEHALSPEHVNTWHLDWFDAEDQSILLMPFKEGEKALAYLNFYGSPIRNSQFLIALFKMWREKYQAQLVAHYGTMLHFSLPQPITNLEDAFEIACQQYQIAPCTTILPGVSLRAHAKALLLMKRWFLHERP